MPPPVIEAGPFTLRPFCDADVARVHEVSRDPAIQGNLPRSSRPTGSNTPPGSSTT